MSNNHLAPLAQTARWTEFRIRSAEAIKALSLGLIPTISSAGAWLAYVKFTHGDHGTPYKVLLGTTIVGAAATLGFVAHAYLRKRPALFGAIELDKAHGLNDRVTNALSFSSLPEDKRTPLMDAAIEDAAQYQGKVSAKKAAPIPLPKDLFVVFGLASLVAIVGSLQWSKHIEIPKKVTAQIDAVNLSQDDIDLLRETLEQLKQKEQNPETQKALEEFNRLVEDLAQKRIDRNEAFRRMEEIERALQKGKESDAKALADALKDMADELKKDPNTKPVAEALAKKDYKNAKKAMKELAQKLKDPKTKMSEADKKRLKEALEKAVQKKKEALQKMKEQREALQASLLQREQKKGEMNEEERRLLQRDKRELERLDRQIEEKERAMRQLDRLDRELSQAAEDLMKELGLSAEDLEKGADDIDRLAKEEMTEQEKEELRKRLEELRDMLRQDSQAKENLKKRMKKFSKKAHGKGGDKDDKDKQKGGDKDDGDDDDDDDDDDGDEDKDGDLRKDKKPGGGGDEDGDKPGGKGKGKGKKGKKIKISMGQGSGDGDQPGSGSGSGQGNQPGNGSGSDGPPGGPGGGVGGKDWGTGSGGAVAGNATNQKWGTHEVQAAANDSGQGPSVSETIAGSARRGFVGRSYKKVYADYKTKAEEAMKNEDIPPGYKFYVQRYFQLIRPRE